MIAVGGCEIQSYELLTGSTPIAYSNRSISHEIGLR
jgi:hypothetical protein